MSVTQPKVQACEEGAGGEGHTNATKGVAEEVEDSGKLGFKSRRSRAPSLASKHGFQRAPWSVWRLGK